MRCLILRNKAVGAGQLRRLAFFILSVQGIDCELMDFRNLLRDSIYQYGIDIYVCVIWIWILAFATASVYRF